MRKTFALILGAAMTLFGVGAASAATARGETCHTSKVAVTHLVKVREKVHGKIKTVEKREVVHIKKRVKEKVRVKVDGKWKTETKLVTKLVVKYRSVTSCTTTVAATTSTTTTATPVVALAAALDPSYVQSSSNPYEVTWSYSASAMETDGGIAQGDPSLPDGVLELYSDGSLIQSSDVGGAATSANATVTYSTWGNHVVDVIYDSGTSSGTSGDESYDIEPPAPQPLVESWGTSSPTSGASISATVSEDETSDDVTLTDPNFEGAQSVTLTDDNGNACTAIVSGTTAECTMDNTATPTSFTVGYPGTQTTQTVYPYGIAQTQEVDWPADQVTISAPSVTTPETIDVSNEIPEIYAELFYDGSGYCGSTYQPSGGYCVMMGVEGLPAGGTLQLTDTYDANGDTESCSVDLTTNYDATTQGCSVLTDPTDSGSDPRSITATYSGATISGYDTYVYAPVSVTYTMVYDPTSGQWWNFYGN